MHVDHALPEDGREVLVVEEFLLDVTDTRIADELPHSDGFVWHPIAPFVQNLKFCRSR